MEITGALEEPEPEAVWFNRSTIITNYPSYKQICIERLKYQWQTKDLY